MAFPKGNSSEPTPVCQVRTVRFREGIPLHRLLPNFKIHSLKLTTNPPLKKLEDETSFEKARNLFAPVGVSPFQGGSKQS